MINNLRHIVIVYNPGYAGNMLQRVFALGERTFPVMTLEHIKDPHAELYLSEARRLENYRFVDAPDWQAFHRGWSDFYHYDNYRFHIECEGDFDNIVFCMHEHERRHVHLPLLVSIPDVTYLTVRLDGWQDWLARTQQTLKFEMRENEAVEYEQFGCGLPAAHHIDLDKILESEQGFVEEYLRIVTLLGLPDCTNSATALYRNWYGIRVRPYL